tara:strand:+ start:714 stop:1043 length:330 start_codon:yes stop_codon:yes gene_type:complete
MKSLQDLRHIIKEQIESNEYKALVEIHFDSEFKVTDILDQVRAFCGVIIVNAESTQRLTDRKQKVLVKIKFYAFETPVKQYLAGIVNKALSVDGIYAFRIKKVKNPNQQ